MTIVSQLGRGAIHHQTLFPTKLEFWVDSFVHFPAFRVGGPTGGAWARHDISYTVLTEVGNVLLLGHVRPGEIVQVPEFNEHHTLMVVVEVTGIRLVAQVAPSRCSSNWSLLQEPLPAVSNVIFRMATAECGECFVSRN